MSFLFYGFGVWGLELGGVVFGVNDEGLGLTTRAHG
jgi:hypothetical protein